MTINNIFFAFLIIAVFIMLLIEYKTNHYSLKSSRKNEDAAIAIQYLFILVDKIDETKKEEKYKNNEVFKELDDVYKLIKRFNVHSFDMSKFIASIKIETKNDAPTYKIGDPRINELFNMKRKFIIMVISHNIGVFNSKKLIEKDEVEERVIKRLIMRTYYLTIKDLIFTLFEWIANPFRKFINDIKKLNIFKPIFDTFHQSMLIVDYSKTFDKDKIKNLSEYISNDNIFVSNAKQKTVA